jgi:isopentenyl-diphosphate delta-isomerase
VEAFRAGSIGRQQIGEAFLDWGIPTATALRMVRDALPDTPLIASGGLKNGVDAAKAMALGADLVGFAGPLLRVATEGEAQVVEALTVIGEQLRLAMFSTGSQYVGELRAAPMMQMGPVPALENPPHVNRASISRTRPAQSTDGRTGPNGDSHASS